MDWHRWASAGAVTEKPGGFCGFEEKNPLSPLKLIHSALGSLILNKQIYFCTFDNLKVWLPSNSGEGCNIAGACPYRAIGGSSSSSTDPPLEGLNNLSTIMCTSIFHIIHTDFLCGNLGHMSGLWMFHVDVKNTYPFTFSFRFQLLSKANSLTLSQVRTQEPMILLKYFESQFLQFFNCVNPCSCQPQWWNIHNIYKRCYFCFNQLPKIKKKQRTLLTASADGVTNSH